MCVSAGPQFTHDTFAPGATCTLSLRPERIVLAPAPAPAGGLAGRVVEAVYAGDTIRYWIETEGAPRLLAKRPNDGQGPVLRPGDPVSVAWRSEDCKVFEGA